MPPRGRPEGLRYAFLAGL